MNAPTSAIPDPTGATPVMAQFFEAKARQPDALATTLLRSLRLPDDESETKSDSAPGERSAAARSAAKSRWAVHHGAVA